MRRSFFFHCVLATLFVACALPVCSMLARSVYIDGRLTFSAYSGVLNSGRQWRLMWNSVSLAAFVAISTVSLGVPLGVLFGKTDMPFKRVFAAAFAAPLLVPPYVFAVSWFDLLGRNGFLSAALGWSAANAAERFLSGFPGCALVHFSVFLPVPILLTMVFLRTVDSRLEEAARIAAGWRGALFGVTLPLILPGILLSGMLVFLLSFGEIGVPNYLRYDVFPLESFIQFSAFYNFETATAAAAPLLAVTLALIALERFFLRDKTYEPRVISGNETFTLIPLGKHGAWISALTALLSFLLVILPISALAAGAGGWDSYAEAFERAGWSLVRSFAYASMGGACVAVFGFLAGYVIHSKSIPGWRLADTLTIFLFALPSSVIGIGLISLWNHHWSNFIYATPAIIILGYLAKYTALGSRITVARLTSIPASMEEAARISGAGWFRSMALVVVPLSARALLAGWLVGYIFSLRDTGITMLVYPPGHETLPVRIFTLMANGSRELVSALCLIMTASALLPLGLAWTAWRVSRAWRKL